MEAMATVLQLVKRLSDCPRPRVLPGIALRHYHDSRDIPTWLELRHRAFARAKPGVQRWTVADFEADLIGRPWWRPERLWFAMAAEPGGGSPFAVGTVVLADRAVGGAIVPAVHWLAVAPTWRRRGVGRHLLETLETRAWELGHREVFLETHVGWTAAARLYESLGYEPATGGIPML